MVSRDLSTATQPLTTIPAAEFCNLTPFPSQYFQALDSTGQVFHVVVLRVTYDLAATPPGGRLRFADVQTPLAGADLWAGEPHRSSVVQESDFAPFKPRCDLVLTQAQAWAPDSRPASRWWVGIQLGQWQKCLQVTGPRQITPRLWGTTLSRPTPVMQAPLGYEQAFGGEYRFPDTPDQPPGIWEVDERNPIGCGAASRRWLRQARPESLPAPQLEVPGQPYTGQRDYPVVGFGLIGRAWLPRRRLAGTYDQAWLDDQWPKPPLDFDYGYWNGAPADQQLPWPRGDEPLRLVGLHPAGVLHCRLPGHRFFTLTRPAHGPLLPKPLNLDTLLIDPTAGQIIAVYRNAVSARLKPSHIQARLEPGQEN